MDFNLGAIALESLEIGANVVKIGLNAFNGCSSLKILSSILLTLEGISMDFNLTQPSKALFPIVLTLFGITIASRLLQA